MDFSSNGKHLATCSEESDPGDETSNSSGSSPEKSSSERKGLSRQQRKNRERKDSTSSPETKKELLSKRLDSRKLTHSPLRQFTNLGCSEMELYDRLIYYLLDMEELYFMGYPVEQESYSEWAIIYKAPLPVPFMYKSYSGLNVNAKEFVPRHQVTDTNAVSYSQITQEWYVSHPIITSTSLDSSNEFSSKSSDNSEALEDIPEEYCKVKGSVSKSSEERQCVRCAKSFLLCNNKYITREQCTYHWGKFQRNYSLQEMKYTCCQGKTSSPGCCTGNLHVWNGVEDGYNGPFDGYMRTKLTKNYPKDGNFGVYALDCEMCYTARGLELTKIAVVGIDGRIVYDTFVKPDLEIVDYNTRFSGITAKDLSNKDVTKSFQQVRNDLMGFINAETILIGHALENDLRSLRLFHSCFVDTAITFPHYNGLPYKRALKTLVSTYLNREIQCSESGHSSVEDARACMELILWKLRKDMCD